MNISQLTPVISSFRETIEAYKQDRSDVRVQFGLHLRDQMFEKWKADYYNNKTGDSSQNRPKNTPEQIGLTSTKSYLETASFLLQSCSESVDYEFIQRMVLETVRLGTISQKFAIAALQLHHLIIAYGSVIAYANFKMRTDPCLSAYVVENIRNPQDLPYPRWEIISNTIKNLIPRIDPLQLFNITQSFYVSRSSLLILENHMISCHFMM